MQSLYINDFSECKNFGLHASSLSKVVGSLGEAPFKMVVKVNFNATLPSCRVFIDNCSSKLSVENPSTTRHKLRKVNGHNIRWAPNMAPALVVVHNDEQRVTSCDDPLRWLPVGVSRHNISGLSGVSI